MRGFYGLLKSGLFILYLITLNGIFTQEKIDKKQQAAFILLFMGKRAGIFQ